YSPPRPAATVRFYPYTTLFRSLVVIGGVHLWLKRTLEERDEPRPWQFPTVLSTAMVAGIFVTLFPIFMSVDLLMPLPLVCLGQEIGGAHVCTPVTCRARMPSPA